MFAVVKSTQPLGSAVTSVGHWLLLQVAFVTDSENRLGSPWITLCVCVCVCVLVYVFSCLWRNLNKCYVTVVAVVIVAEAAVAL